MLFLFDHQLVEEGRGDQGKAPHTKSGYLRIGGIWELFLIFFSLFPLCTLCTLPVCSKDAKSRGEISLSRHGYLGSGKRPRVWFGTLGLRGERVNFLSSLRLWLCAHNNLTSYLSKSQVLPEGCSLLLLLLLICFFLFAFEQSCLWPNKLQPHQNHHKTVPAVFQAGKAPNFSHLPNLIVVVSTASEGVSCHAGERCSKEGVCWGRWFVFFLLQDLWLLLWNPPFQGTFAGCIPFYYPIEVDPFTSWTQGQKPRLRSAGWKQRSRSPFSRGVCHLLIPRFPLAPARRNGGAVWGEPGTWG